MSIRVLLLDDPRILLDAARAFLSSEDRLDAVGDAEHGRAAVAKALTRVPEVLQ